jgi:hypothetical protein
MITITGLSNFIGTESLVYTEQQVKKVLQDPGIKKIICCCLGPKGTNIGQAAEKWASRMGLGEKTKVKFSDTPEAALEIAEETTSNCSGVLGIFWTCAVYSRESALFFSNPNTLPFFTQEIMPLDTMQLATREGLFAEAQKGNLPIDWKIATHPSPQYLVTTKLQNPVIIANSNSAAARDCAKGKAEACITTEEARKTYDLKTLHVFGSPPMVFFGGITEQGLALVQRIWQDLKR